MLHNICNSFTYSLQSQKQFRFLPIECDLNIKGQLYSGLPCPCWALIERVRGVLLNGKTTTFRKAFSITASTGPRRSLSGGKSRGKVFLFYLCNPLRFYTVLLTGKSDLVFGSLEY